MSATKLRLFGAANDSIVDGPGLRLAVFVQGCPHGCPGCHNPGSHPADGGYLQSIDSLVGVLCGNTLLDGVTFSGGEPMMQAAALTELARVAHEHRLDVWCYTGFLYEDVLAGTPSEDAAELLHNVDVLVDGPYVQDRRSLELKWRGSSNQRIIDVPASLAAGQVVLWRSPDDELPQAPHFSW